MIQSVLSNQSIIQNYMMTVAFYLAFCSVTAKKYY